MEISLPREANSSEKASVGFVDWTTNPSTIDIGQFFSPTRFTFINSNEEN